MSKQWSSFDEVDVWATDGDQPDPAPEHLPIPAGWRILVRPLTPMSKTKGGILLSDETIKNQASIQTVGRVLALGPQAYNRNDMGDPWVKVGDYVLYGKWAGFKVSCEGVKLIVLNDDEVVATVKAPDEIQR